jgi:hypothetical protein
MKFENITRNQERLLFVSALIMALGLFYYYLQHVRAQYDQHSFVRIANDISDIAHFKKRANPEEKANDLISVSLLSSKIGELYFYYQYVEKSTVNKNRFCKVYDAHTQLFDTALEGFEIPDLTKKIAFDCDEGKHKIN